MCVGMASSGRGKVNRKARSNFPKDVSLIKESMQTKKQKEDIVSDVAERARASKSVVFAKYAGLTVKSLWNFSENPKRRRFVASGEENASFDCTQISGH